MSLSVLAVIERDTTVLLASMAVGLISLWLKQRHETRQAADKLKADLAMATLKLEKANAAQSSAIEENAKELKKNTETTEKIATQTNGGMADMLAKALQTDQVAAKIQQIVHNEFKNPRAAKHLVANIVCNKDLLLQLAKIERELKEQEGRASEDKEHEQARTEAPHPTGEGHPREAGRHQPADSAAEKDDLHSQQEQVKRGGQPGEGR